LLAAAGGRDTGIADLFLSLYFPVHVIYPLFSFQITANAIGSVQRRRQWHIFRRGKLASVGRCLWASSGKMPASERSGKDHLLCKTLTFKERNTTQKALNSVPCRAAQISWISSWRAPANQFPPSQALLCSALQEKRGLRSGKKQTCLCTQPN